MTWPVVLPAVTDSDPSVTSEQPLVTSVQPGPGVLQLSVHSHVLSARSGGRLGGHLSITSRPVPAGQGWQLAGASGVHIRLVPCPELG